METALGELGRKMVLDYMNRRDSITPTPQPNGATMAPKLAPGEERVDWNRPAAEIHNLIRACNPHPKAWFEYEGRRIFALKSAVLRGVGTADAEFSIKLETSQVSGSRPASPLMERAQRGLQRSSPAESGTRCDGGAAIESNAKVSASETPDPGIRSDDWKIPPPGTVVDDALAVACGGGTAIRLLEIQKPGGRPMPARDFLNGRKIAAGEVLE
jgi:methionyl-tRNA formyltransferase